MISKISEYDRIADKYGISNRLEVKRDINMLAENFPEFKEAAALINKWASNYEYVRSGIEDVDEFFKELDETYFRALILKRTLYVMIYDNISKIGYEIDDEQYVRSKIHEYYLNNYEDFLKKFNLWLEQGDAVGKARKKIDRIHRKQARERMKNEPKIEFGSISEEEEKAIKDRLSKDKTYQSLLKFGRDINVLFDEQGHTSVGN